MVNPTSFDPTREELDEILRAWPYYLEASAFDIEGAIYWFAYDWHGGQWTNLYSVLSTSAFNPGPRAKGPVPESVEADLYRVLCDHFGVPVEDKYHWQQWS